MKISYLHEFLLEFEALDKAVQRQLRKTLEELYRTPDAQLSHQALKGQQFRGLFKLRVGDWRLIYRMHAGELVFVTLGHRSEVYDL